MTQKTIFKVGDKVRIKGIDHVFTLEDTGDIHYPLKIVCPKIFVCTLTKEGSVISKFR